MKTNKSNELPRIIEKALLKVAKIIYYRFEFSRGDSGIESFGTNVVIEYDNGERRWLEKAFPRISRRNKFLSPPGTATYLEDLKRDLGKCGQKERAFVKYMVEYTRAPLCPRSSVQCSSHLEPFFPSSREVAGRLLAYFRELFMVQEFLIRELKVKPGSLLPVWIVDEPSVDNPDPLLGFLPVRKSTVNALTEYILWELGLPYDAYHYEKILLDRNNEEFYDNALRWSRLNTLRFIRENDINERTDEYFLGSPPEKKRIMQRIKESLPEDLQQFPPSWFQEVLLDVNRRKETPKPVVRKFKKKRSEDNDYASEGGMGRKDMADQTSGIVQSPTFISRVNRALACGDRMFREYRNFW